jgi:hypothetical protein
VTAVFISHSGRDAKVSGDVKAFLAKLGIERIFLDFDKASGIGAGEDWEQRLYREISRCHAVILVLTPNWLKSKWCFAEFTHARALGKIILPVICEPIGDTKVVLPQIQSVDLVDWSESALGRIESRLREVDRELAHGFVYDPARLPFPGTHSFEEEDAAIYFARDGETLAITERLNARRLHAVSSLFIVVGASGAGKSSLLKAGVIPQLKRRPREWIVLPVVRPGRGPVEAIAKAIAEHLGQPAEWRIWLDNLTSSLAGDRLARLVSDLRIGGRADATVVFPIDQFEEAFAATEKELAAFRYFLKCLLDPAANLPVIVVATGRSDVLEGVLDEATLVPAIEAYPVAPLPLERVPAMVTGPARVAALAVEPELVGRIARDVETAEALPLLAHVLWQLYPGGKAARELNLRKYVELGDAQRGLNPIQNSVRKAADGAISALNPSDADLSDLRDAFLAHLVRVRLEDGKRIRQVAYEHDLPATALRFIRALVDARVLVSRLDGDPALPVIEVAHEALFKAWDRLDRWLTEEREFLADLERIRAAHEVWTSAMQSDKGRALLRGLLLSRARDWTRRYPKRFESGRTGGLREFVQASVAAERASHIRARRIRRALVVVGMIAAVVVGIFAVDAARQRRLADNRSEMSHQVARTLEVLGVFVPEEALALMSTAINSLVTSDPSANQEVLTQIDAIQDSARFFYESWDGELAQVALKYSDELLRRAEQAGVSGPDIARLKAASFEIRGDVNSDDSRQFPMALKAYGDTLALLKNLDEGSPRAPLELARVHRKIAKVQIASGKDADAAAQISEAARLLDKAGTDGHSERAMLGDVRASLAMAKGDWSTARHLIQGVIALDRQVRADAQASGRSVLAATEALAIHLQHLGDCLRHENGDAAAYAAYEEAETVILGVLGTIPTEGGIRFMLDLVRHSKVLLARGGIAPIDVGRSAASTPSHIERVFGQGYGRIRFGMSPDQVNALLQRPFGSMAPSQLPRALEYRTGEVVYFWTPIVNIPELLKIYPIPDSCLDQSDYAVFMFHEAALMRISVRLQGPARPGCPDRNLMFPTMANQFFLPILGTPKRWRLYWEDAHVLITGTTVKVNAQALGMPMLDIVQR